MGDFFKGWRRKTGIVALVMACVFMTGWVRTYSVTDDIHVPLGKTTSFCASSYRSNLIFQVFSQAIVFRRSSISSRVNTIYPWNDETRTALDMSGFGGGAIDKDPDDPTRECEMWSCPVKLCGCAVFLRSTLASGRGILGIFIPYWSIVIPLTLLSAFLLITKPLPAKSM